MPHAITRKQQGLMFSSNSPLSKPQQNRLADELRRGKVRIKAKKGK